MTKKGQDIITAITRLLIKIYKIIKTNINQNICIESTPRTKSLEKIIKHTPHKIIQKNIKRGILTPDKGEPTYKTKFTWARKINAQYGSPKHGNTKKDLIIWKQYTKAKSYKHKLNGKIDLQIERENSLARYSNKYNQKEISKSHSKKQTKPTPKHKQHIEHDHG